MTGEHDGGRARARRVVGAALLAGGILTSPLLGATNSADNLRTGWYPDQATLTPALVGGGTFGQLWTAQMNGQIYAQPLVANGVLLVVSETNWIYGLDPETGAVRWSRNVGTAWNPNDVNCSDLVPNIGITSTPVIDEAAGTAYFVAKTYVSGSSGAAAWNMHAVDIVNGNERAGFPVLLQGTAQNNAGRTFDAVHEMQRPGLLLLDGVVYAAFGAHCDAVPWEGWIFGVSTAGTLTARWVAMGASGSGAGIWQSGGGLVSDGPGRIIFVTGNGGAPGTSIPGSTPPASLGESVVRLQVQANGTLQAVDFFAPFDAVNLDSWDADFSSGAPLALPDQYFGTPTYPHLLVGVGKQGYVYLFDRNDLGGCRQGQGNGDDVVARVGPYGGVWSHPTTWPGDGGYIYMPTASGGNTGEGSQGVLRYFKYTLDGQGKPTLALVGTSTDAFGFSSSMAVVTSNGTTSGSALLWLVWAPDGSGTGAQIRCYDPIPISNVPHLRWSAPIGISSKFAPPGVGPNGRIYVGTREGKIFAFGAPITPTLSGSTLTFPTTAIGNNATQNDVLTANRAVSIVSLSSSNPQFTLGSPTPALPASLSPGQTITIPVTFTPTSVGLVAATLVVQESGVTQESFGIQGTGQYNGPLLTASPPAVSFGGTAVGGHLASVVTFANQGSAALTITAQTLPSAPFSAGGLPSIGQVLNPGDSIAASVFFDPTTSGYFSDDLSLDSTGGTADVPLSGNAAVPGALRITPLDLPYGPIAIGGGLTAAFTVENTGDTTITITKSKTPVLGQFTNLTNLFEGSTMAPGEIRTEVVRFAPTTLGFQADSWQINSTAPGGLQVVNFTGNGVANDLLPGPWTFVFVDSQETAGEDGRGLNAIDNSPSTIWHTQWQAASPPPPHEIQVDLRTSYDVDAFRYLPRQDGQTNGRIGQFEFYVSTDGFTWGTPVATGDFTNDATEKEVRFPSKTGRYVRLRALDAANGDPYTSMAELRILGSLDTGNAPPIAAAGLDQAVPCYLPAATIVLDGSASTHASGASLSYAWTQTGGPTVVLTGANTARATFAAPVVSGGTVLTFQLQVNDGTTSSFDAVTVAVPDLVDADNDLAPACNDCAPTVTATHPPPEAQNLLFSNKTTLAWSTAAGATGYDLERGTLATPGTPFTYNHDCIATGLASPTTTDAATPAPGGVYYYLARATNTCGFGNVGEAGPGSPRPYGPCGGAGSSHTVDFNNLSNPGHILNGQYPAGVIDWGTNKWYLSGPWQLFTTNSVNFSGSNPTSEPFTFISPKVLTQLDAYNGQGSSCTVTISCTGQTTKQLVVPANTVVTIPTGWTGACTNVTIGASNGFWTNFDNLVYH